MEIKLGKFHFIGATAALFHAALKFASLKKTKFKCILYKTVLLLYLFYIYVLQQKTKLYRKLSRTRKRIDLA